MTRRLACIVEGHGETQAVPVLLPRIANEVPGLLRPQMRARDIIRVPRSRLLRAGELERAVELAGRRVGPAGAVLIVIDADDDAACQLGPELLRRAVRARSDVRTAVVLAVREYEAWLLASLDSLRGSNGIPSNIRPPEVEALRDAKGWLGRHMTGGYRPVLHQARLTALIDIDAARATPSFGKLLREVTSLLAPDE